MTVSAAILALSLAARPPLSLVREAERLELPPGAAAVRIEARPFERRWILWLPPAAVPATAIRLRGSSRLCPDIAAAADHVVLRCTSSRLRASVVHDRAGTAVELVSLSVPPWRPEEEGPPLVPFDVEALRLGGCPGSTPELQGECALAAGDLDAAARLFEEAARAGNAPLAHLRLGDLALRDDEPDRASLHWRMARAVAPWGRLATARLCELDAKCLASEAVESVYDASAVDRPLRADLVLRWARLAAFEGHLADSARRVSSESGPGGACQAAQPWCRHLLLRALEAPGPEGLEALVPYLELPGRGAGPLALELVRAAALQAERAGAEQFAANLLASATGSIPAGQLEPHLRRVATLYLAAGDRPHADEVVRYARSRLGDASLRGADWSALRRAVRITAHTAERRDDSTSPDADLAAAQAAVAAARVVTAAPARKGAAP